MAASLEQYGLTAGAATHWNLSEAALIEQAICRHEGVLASSGPFCTVTAPYTGRSPNDKFIVREASSESDIAWGDVNRPMTETNFEGLRNRALEQLNSADRFVCDTWAGTDPDYRVSLRLISTKAWANLFVCNMFVKAGRQHEEPGFLILHAPDAKADPDTDNTNSEAFIAVHFGRREVVIGGTKYAGEIKKSMFTVMNYLLPAQGVFPMHCSANASRDGASAVFFGLSGTGKTTLSSDPERTLVGDDEHGWSDSGIFNFEGGCYAKVIRLSAEREPEIYNATRRFGTILENVVVDPSTRELDLDDASITENTRASYPIRFIPTGSETGMASHPTDVVFLTADAFGVLPPISRLSTAQARYFFLSGYTAKVAGTERGVTDPQATFSVCFGAPFLPRPAGVYSRMLGEKLEKHSARVWLVNTGWTKGAFGTGERIAIPHTRAMLHAALTGRLDDVATKTDPVFGLKVPLECADVPSEILQPRDSWPDQDAYDETAAKLAGMFTGNFKAFESEVPQEVRNAGPAQ